jgi:hypothetical protein
VSLLAFTAARFDAQGDDGLARTTRQTAWLYGCARVALVMLAWGAPQEHNQFVTAFIKSMAPFLDGIVVVLAGLTVFARRRR